MMMQAMIRANDEIPQTSGVTLRALMTIQVTFNDLIFAETRFRLRGDQYAFRVREGDGRSVRDRGRLRSEQGAEQGQNEYEGKTQYFHGNEEGAG